MCSSFLAISNQRAPKPDRDIHMTRHPLEASDMAAGRAARAAGIACHYNPFDFYAEPQRYCAWKEGWRA
jgi:hypothetical protein